MTQPKHAEYAKIRQVQDEDNHKDEGRALAYPVHGPQYWVLIAFLSIRRRGTASGAEAGPPQALAFSARGKRGARVASAPVRQKCPRWICHVPSSFPGRALDHPKPFIDRGSPPMCHCAIVPCAAWKNSRSGPSETAGHRPA